MTIKVKKLGVGDKGNKNSFIEIVVESQITILELIELLLNRNFITYQPLVLVNGKYKQLKFELSDGDEVTLILPVSGG